MKPVVDSVILPAHAQTSQICTIDITWVITVTGGEPVSATYGYTYAPLGSPLPPPTQVNFTSSVNETVSLSLAPGQYEVSAGASATIADQSGVEVTGQTSLSCCSASTPMGDSWTVNQSNQNSGDGANVLVTIGSDGSCQIDPAPAPSDIRLKINIEALSNSREGYNLYKFQYIGEDNGNTYVGVMAQDVLSSHPEAVIQNESGFYMVLYDKLGLKMVTLDHWINEGPDCVELFY
jgi:hypothetical protein